MKNALIKCCFEQRSAHLKFFLIGAGSDRSPYIFFGSDRSPQIFFGSDRDRFGWVKKNLDRDRNWIGFHEKSISEVTGRGFQSVE